jgi:hypothetical protein
MVLGLTGVSIGYWLRRVFGKRGHWASIANRGAVVYCEDGRMMTIAGEMLKDGFEI